jgi:hypothetical protein
MKNPKEVDHSGKVVTREELYEAVWSKTLKSLALEWNVTHEQLLLACKRMCVPRPNQRYWPLISWGHRVGRKPLRRRSRKTPSELLLPARGRARGALAVEISVKEEERRGPAEARELEERRRVEEAPAVAERSQSNSELLIALAASVDRNERVQERFRNAVVRKLARLEARARLLQLSKIIDWLPGGPVDEAVRREAGIEAMVSEVSEEIERKMLKEISVERGAADAPRGRPRTWSDWEI